MFTTGPAFFVQRSYTGVLDAYKTGLWSCWSVEKRLIGAYGIGPAINVRRDSDNATTDIHWLAAGGLDTTTLMTFAGSASVYIADAYDQSGGGNSWPQASNPNQPRIVNAGVYDGKIVFNPTATATWLKTANNSASVNAKSIFRKINTRTAGATIDFVYGDSTKIGAAGSDLQMQFNNGTGVNAMALYIGSAPTNTGQYVPKWNGVTQSNTVNGIICISGAGSAAASGKLYQDGSLKTQSGTTTNGTVTAASPFPAYYWGLGAVPETASAGAAIDMWSCALYDADKSTDALAINAALA